MPIVWGLESSLTARLRIRTPRTVIAPEQVDARSLFRSAPARGIGVDDFFTACQRVVGVHTTDDDDIAWAERRGDRVRIELHDGEVRFDSARPWVVRLALGLAAHLRGAVVDTRGASIWGPDATRHPGHSSVLSETSIDGEHLPPDWTESALMLGWPPVTLREPVVLAAGGDVPDTQVVRRRGELWVTWTGHPAGKQVIGVVADDGRLRIASPDVHIARWMVELARHVGTVCTDEHGLIWMESDGPDPVEPMWPAECPDHGTTIQRLLNERSRAALNIEAALNGNTAAEERPATPMADWWQVMLQRAAKASAARQ